MRNLRVLGSCGAWPEAGRAASGFLVEWDGFRIVLDLGYATFPRLLTHCPAAEVDAVVITHGHADHCVDAHALYRARAYGGAKLPRIPLFCIEGVVERLAAFDPRADLHEVYDVCELPWPQRAGPFGIEGVELPHHVPNVGVRLEAAGMTLAYTGDTGPDSALADLGAGADLFIVEATEQGGPLSGPPRLDLTAAEAGTWAARAGARRLMLTHFWPGSDRAVSAAEAAAAFAGELLTAEEDLLVPLG
ncbi:MAG TPA: MBL fold metallo-hydrolase [Streptosporangiaceae bacterium]|nr:MBL fold metallo-hydrolase [Streptosporangiaceae bacterium]